MTTVGTVCDRIIECEDREDEPAFCEEKSTHLLIVLTLAIIFLYYGSKVSFLVLSKLLKKENERKFLRQKWNLATLFNEYRDNHEDERIAELVNTHFLHRIFTNSRGPRREESILLFDLETKLHKNNKAEIFCCLHSRFDPRVCELIIDTRFPGFIDKYFGKIKGSLQNIFTREKWIGSINLIRRSNDLFSYFFDILKDSYLCYRLFSLNGGLIALWMFPSKFSSVVVLSLSSSVILPLLLSSIHLTLNFDNIITLVNPKKRFKRTFTTIIKFGTLLLSILNPVILTNAFELMKEKARIEAKTPNNHNVIKYYRRSHLLQKCYVQFKRIELGLEIFYQVSGQIILLVLSKTKTSTTGGLERIFDESEFFGFPLQIEVFLAFSIVLGLKSGVLLHLKTIQVEKGFFPATSKLFAFLWILFATGRRITSIVSFFIPFLGLFNVLNHWRAEQLPFRLRRVMEPASDDRLELFNMTEQVLWSDIDRWRYSDLSKPLPPHYSLYTGLALGEAFKVFIVIMGCHFIFIAIIKLITVENFRSCDHFSKFVHILENMNFAFPWADWDQERGGVQELRDRFRRLNMEMLLTMIVNCVFSILMLCPIWYSGE